MLLSKTARAVAACAVLGLVAAVPAPGAAAAPAGTAAVDPAVLARTELSGTSTFFVRLKSGADLHAGLDATDRTERVRRVYEAKRAHAEHSQAALREVLTARKAPFTPYWITNAIRVTGDKRLLLDLAAHPDVAEVLPDREYHLATPVHREDGPRTQAVEWNVERVRAPEVWQTYNTRGEGIVVGTIDTGAQFDHPAIARQYRGARVGAPDHDYNWFDPSHVCGNPSGAPCDNVGHGTHVLGTVLGDDGGDNKTGVAPGARWIAAKGCETDSCSTSALLASGQWMVAPTDAAGHNPRPDLAPDVVNNSWGGSPNDPFYRDIVSTWVAAGIFPVFSAGNNGSAGCGTVGSPGDYPASYAVGASTADNGIAWYSSRGPSAVDGGAKPDIVAPGDDVRSSVPGGYASYSGTSMAAPHVTGAIALVWSASPHTRRQVAQTRELLDGSAVATADGTCGGTGSDNNVWGRGRLDAFAAVTRAPRGPVGHAAGTVRSGGLPLADVEVRVDDGAVRTTRTAADGTYALPNLPVGEHTVTAGAFGYLTVSARVTITEDTTATADFDLAAAPRHTVSGQVRDAGGAPVADSEVTAVDAPLPPVRTDAEGRYRVADVPTGQYDLTAAGGRCLLPQRLRVEVDGDERVDFTLPVKGDAHGHVCATGASSWTDTGTTLQLQGDDASTPVDLPFPVNLYDQSYRRVNVSTNGFLSFTTTSPVYLNTPLPATGEPNAAVYALWDDLVVDGGASVRTATTGEPGRREFVVEWRDVRFVGAPETVRVSFQVVLREHGPISLRYRGIGDQPVEAGASATVGVEDETGTDALEYAHGQPVLRDDVEITFSVPGTGLVRGRVLDAGDRGPVADAEVTAVREGRPDLVVRTDRDGYYQLRARVGDVRLSAAREHYETAGADVRLSEPDRVVERDFELRTAALQAEPATLDLVVPQGESRRRTVRLGNTGSAEATWEVREAGGEATRQAASVRQVADPSARTSAGVVTDRPDVGTATAGRVIRSWPTTGVGLGWGVAARDGAWISDGSGRANRYFTGQGVPGVTWSAPWADWPADAAHVPGRDLVCQVAVGGDNGIHCWNPATGEDVERIAGPLPWTATSQRGLAYRPDDDTFYVGGWNEGVIYHVKGLSHPDTPSTASTPTPARPCGPSRRPTRSRSPGPGWTPTRSATCGRCPRAARRPRTWSRATRRTSPTCRGCGPSRARGGSASAGRRTWRCGSTPPAWHRASTARPWCSPATAAGNRCGRSGCGWSSPATRRGSTRAARPASTPSATPGRPTGPTPPVRGGLGVRRTAPDPTRHQGLRRTGRGPGGTARGGRRPGRRQLHRPAPDGIRGSDRRTAQPATGQTGRRPDRQRDPGDTPPRPRRLRARRAAGVRPARPTPSRPVHRVRLKVGMIQ
nr:S8 family serine peptidase [Saccharothrix syringae]